MKQKQVSQKTDCTGGFQRVEKFAVLVQKFFGSRMNNSLEKLRLVSRKQYSKERLEQIWNVLNEKAAKIEILGQTNSKGQRVVVLNVRNTAVERNFRT